MYSLVKKNTYMFRRSCSASGVPTIPWNKWHNDWLSLSENKHIANGNLVLESEIQPTISLPLPGLRFILIPRFLFHTHGVPRLLFLVIQIHEVLPLQYKHDKSKSADSDQDLIPSVIIGSIVCTIYL